jgi:hypothetical protein
VALTAASGLIPRGGRISGLETRAYATLFTRQGPIMRHTPPSWQHRCATYMCLTPTHASLRHHSLEPAYFAGSQLHRFCPSSSMCQSPRVVIAQHRLTLCYNCVPSDVRPEDLGVDDCLRLHAISSSLQRLVFLSHLVPCSSSVSGCTHDFQRVAVLYHQTISIAITS